MSQASLTCWPADAEARLPHSYTYGGHPSRPRWRGELKIYEERAWWTMSGPSRRASRAHGTAGRPPRWSARRRIGLFGAKSRPGQGHKTQYRQPPRPPPPSSPTAGERPDPAPCREVSASARFDHHRARSTDSSTVVTQALDDTLPAMRRRLERRPGDGRSFEAHGRSPPMKPHPWLRAALSPRARPALPAWTRGRDIYDLGRSVRSEARRSAWGGLGFLPFGQLRQGGKSEG